MNENFLEAFGKLTDAFLEFAPFAFAAIVFFSMALRPLRNGIKLSLRIAVIGLPRSGKTTLIAVLFDRIMSERYARYITVNGAETVERISQYLGMIASGHNLGPTTDRDVFAFRYLINKPLLGFIPRKYDVEIADFPGEYSEDISSTSSLDLSAPHSGLYRSEFFSWVVRADRYIFVVDSEGLLAADPLDRLSYITSMTLRIKTSVLLLKQELLDESVYQRPCALVFTKCDLLLRSGNLNNLDDLPVDKLERRNLKGRWVGDKGAFGPDDHRAFSSDGLVVDEFDEIALRMHSDFSDLERFLHSNFRSVVTVCHSSKIRSRLFDRSTDSLIGQISPL